MRADTIAVTSADLPRWVLWGIVLAAVVLGVLVAWNTAVTTVVFLTLCACLLAWARPIAVISGLAFYIPIERFITVRLPDLAFLISQVSGEVVLLALLGGILVRKLASRKPFTSTPLDAPLLAFIGACLLSAFVNGVGAKSTVYGMRVVLRYAILFYAIANAGFTKRQLRVVVLAYLAAAGLQIAAGLTQALSGGAAKEWFIASRDIRLGDVILSKGQRASAIGHGLFTVIFGTMDSYNDYGMFLAAAWLAAYALWRTGPDAWGRARLRVLLLLGFACVLLSFSRSSLLTVLIGTAVLGHLSGGRRIAYAILVVLIVGLSVITFLGMRYAGENLPVYSTSIVYRWVRPFTAENMAVTQAGNFRLFLLFVVSAKVLAISPLFGLGPGTFGSALTMSPSSEMYASLGMTTQLAPGYAADSNWTTMLAQTGLLGLAAFIFIVTRMASYSVRLLRHSSDPMVRGVSLAQIGVTAGIVVAGFFGPFFEARYTSFYFWVVSGMVAALARVEGVPSRLSWLSNAVSFACRGRDGTPEALAQGDPAVMGPVPVGGKQTPVR